MTSHDGDGDGGGDGDGPHPIGKEDDERGESAGQTGILSPENQDSWPGDTSDSESTTGDGEDKRETEGKTGEEITAAEDEEDGFRTPTSSEHRIPAPTVCPPAPRKPCPKRRRSRSPAARRCLELDASEEVESVLQSEDGGGDEPENKRARKSNGDGGNEGRS
ncbi:Cyclin-dependent protein kinase inhibitor SMR3 [Striga hermonthica]|uniref:Cyclin-dependent protein kinase inhibitor SMR3 n=1 Tax=Striga hermonthica TaxID=68872 RepID=A0A9N7NTC2_STRHE|nr:Cyclin-dependent protein kinase inhibitor SMR3 [Striga hermonthica]